MKAHVVLLVALGLAAGGLGSGCSTYYDSATGEEATFTFQTLRARLDLDIATVYAAAERAAVDLRLRMVRAAEDGISGRILATNAQWEPVEIELGALPGGRTVLTIGVGVFGDKNKSIVLFERIMSNLSEMQQASAAPSVQWGQERR